MKKTFYISKYQIWTGSNDLEFPNTGFVPSLIKRRLTNVEKIGIFLANELEPLFKLDCVVFASQFGEWQQTLKLIEQMHSDNEMSPAGFSHSVHNAMPGLWAIIKNSQCNYTTVAANEDTIECAIIESLSRTGQVLLIYAEESTPDLYKKEFTDPFYGHGVAILLSNDPETGARKISIEFANNNKNKHIAFDELLSFLTDRKILEGKYFTMKVT